MTRSPALALAVAGAVTLGCATSAPASESRELPPGLTSLSALLEGCAPDADVDGGVLMRCPNDVTMSTRGYREGTEASYKLHAAKLAGDVGAQLQWDQVVVPTEAESGLVDRARAVGAHEAAATMTLLGAVHRPDGGGAEEVWCSSKDGAGGERCVELMGAALGRREGVPVHKPAARGPATFLGRSLSVPTSCDVSSSSKKSGALECPNGVSVVWSAFPSMEDAVQALHARLSVAGDDAEGEPFECAIGGEIAKCEARAHSIAGVTYIEGEAVMVACMGPGDLKKDSACRAVLLPR